MELNPPIQDKPSHPVPNLEALSRHAADGEVLPKVGAKHTDFIQVVAAILQVPEKEVAEVWEDPDPEFAEEQSG